MNGIFSKFTFGFVMAQLFPGIIVLISISVLFQTIYCDSSSLSEVVEISLKYWTMDAAHNVMALMMATGFCMAVHGLNWSTIGFMEYAYDKNNEDLGIYESAWHKKPIFKQILLGPIKMIYEVVDFLRYKGGLANITLGENVSDIPPEKWAAFEFVQNFYLYFAQFYAHTAYALLVSVFSVLAYATFCVGKLSYPLLAIALYIISGSVFIVSRIQYGSLFTAEYSLAGKLDVVGKKVRRAKSADKAKD